MADANKYSEFQGRVVRFHLDRAFVRVEKEDDGTTTRTELPHFSAVLVDVTPDGAATLKVCPPRDGLHHLGSMLGAGKAKHVHVVEGVALGKGAGCWEPED